ncbi:superoxide dismutase [Deinococcus sp.]|uniref:superoxide dismutase n=1 Tax=Deinococcus sp. TaxID=47478 RepID=UPI0025C3A5EF|nr:superoxide dismutase [Deinococcus sp.]
MTITRLLLGSTLALTLGSCAMLSPATGYTLARQPAGGALSSSGVVNVKKDGMTVMTGARVSGLAPNTYYVAHYHLQGAASKDPCSSGGAPIMTSALVGRSDATGMLSLTGSVAAADVMNATYFNIHTAKDATGAPADAGVTCTSVKM